MDILSLEELKSFIGIGRLCVSLYMPMQHKGADAFQNPVLLKNLLARAEQELTRRNLEEDAIRRLLRPAYSLLEDAGFWGQPGEGLALFLAPDLFRPYRLPLSFTETVFIGPRFLIRPLLPLLSGNERFFVLALSQNAVRLLEGTREDLQELYLEGVPRSLAETLQYDEPQAHQNVNYHANRPFPGNNEPKEDRKEKILHFFHLVDHALAKSVCNDTEPFVLAGVDYEIALYRQATSCPYLTDESILGNPEHLSLEVLHERAWKIVRPYLQQAQHRATAQFAERIGTGLASENIHEIVPAAWCGRIATLLVRETPSVYGSFDPEPAQVSVSPIVQAGDEDLVNLAMIETLLHKGVVYADPSAVTRHTKPLAALYRY